MDWRHARALMPTPVVHPETASALDTPVSLARGVPFAPRTTAPPCPKPGHLVDPAQLYCDRQPSPIPHLGQERLPGVGDAPLKTAPRPPPSFPAPEAEERTDAIGIAKGTGQTLSANIGHLW